MIEINVKNLNQKRRVPVKKLKEFVLFILNKVSKKKHLTINLVFTSDYQIKMLNKEFKKKNTPTDVLCFCMFEGKTIRPFKENVADIYISSDMAFKKARNYDMTYTKELFFYVAHGILHMLGMRDNSQMLRDKMHKRQYSLLNGFLGIKK